jgi:antirestriction protein ArdC
MTRPKMTKADIERKVTAGILAALERGTVPWRQDWTPARGKVPGDSTRQRSYAGRPYRGINTWILEAAAAECGYVDRRWITFNQARKLEARVRKGEKGTAVVLWKPIEKTDDDGERSSFLLMRYFVVFNVEQVDGLPVEEPAPEADGDTGEEWDAIDAAEMLASDYLEAERISLQHVDMRPGEAPHYTPAFDGITMPQRSQYAVADHYYATLFHECGHSTGTDERVGRFKLVTPDRHTGNMVHRAEEELTAELTAALLAAQTGLDLSELTENHAAYVASWRRHIGTEPAIVIKAAQRAQKAVDYILESAATVAVALAAD